MGSTDVRRCALLLAMMPALLLPTAPTATAADTDPSSCAAFESIAHRGLHPAGIDENSYQAFEQGASRGFSLELDVRDDADGTLWVFHDPNARRATGVDRLISTMSTSEVRALRYRKAGSALLTLDQAMNVFASHPGTNVYLEPKSVPVASATADVVLEYGRTANTWLTGKGREVRKAHPEIRQVLKVVPGTQPDAGDVVASGYDTVALPTRGITAEKVSYYRSAGLTVQGRNVTGTIRWRSAIAAGVTGQLTDSVLELRRFCPWALSAPAINSARSIRRAGVTKVVVRGTALYDTSTVRLGGRRVAFSRVGGTKVVVRTPRTVLRGMRVAVVTPNGVARRVVRRG